MKKISVLFLILCFLFSCSKNGEKTPLEYTGTPDYSEISNWAYSETEVIGKKADVFLVCPTVFLGNTEDGIFNMALDDMASREVFLGALNMERGIYDSQCRMFAPYYRQIGLNVYELSLEERETFLSLAYKDVEKAFDYYITEINQGRPFILAGFSQGADMCIRLMKEYFGEKEFEKLVACYAIGWALTKEDIDAQPLIKPALSESDTGVVISFNSESPETAFSLMVPENSRSFSINPLNWKTDSTPASKDLNIGACFTDYSGNIIREVPFLTGCYLDSKRGALKITDVAPEEYPPVLDIFSPGVYHLYDYQFFYRNLEQNVLLRIEEFTKEKK